MVLSMDEREDDVKQVQRWDFFTDEEKHTISEALIVARNQYRFDADGNKQYERIAASFTEQAKRCDVLIDEVEA